MRTFCSDPSHAMSSVANPARTLRGRGRVCMTQTGQNPDHIRTSLRNRQLGDDFYCRAKLNFEASGRLDLRLPIFVSHSVHIAGHKLRDRVVEIAHARLLFDDIEISVKSAAPKSWARHAAHLGRYLLST